jgi:hypothetical protein
MPGARIDVRAVFPQGVLAPEPLEAGLERRQLGAVLVRAEIAERQQLLRRGRPELGVALST